MIRLFTFLQRMFFAPRCGLCGAVACADDRPYCPECLIWSVNAVGAPSDAIDEFDEETS